MKKLLASSFIIVALSLFAQSIAAQSQQVQLTERKVGVVWKNQNAKLYVSIADFLSPTVKEKLTSGLPQTMVLQAFGYEKNSNKAIAVYASSCRIVYDLWDEVYRIERQVPGQSAHFIVKYPTHVASVCLALKGATMKEVSRDDRDVVYFAISVELNPLSDRALERIRRWLVRPSGTSGLGDDAFFGSFVRLFVNPRIGKADRVLRFRSQLITVPSP
ncbi:MAG: hypothetical protein IPJ88_03510 [Myxococcales bacterium]|nr:MAG: hypothetical protein IPJ88_03510 [Myxococcales bacterium]